MIDNPSKKADLKRKQLLSRHLKNIEGQEHRLFDKKENAFMSSRINPVVDKIQDKIPDKLSSTLNTAFYKGFQMVFEKGNTLIEKTYNKNKLEQDYDLNNYSVEKYPNRKHFKRLDKQSGHTKIMNSSIAAIEGGVLGILGIGLPDIPLFISVIIKTINEIALSYGYQYKSNEEKAYILTLICGAMSKGDVQMRYSAKLDSMGAELDSDIIRDINLKEMMREAADQLSEALLTAKFIQGIPFVGVIGGVVNHSIINKIGKYAKLKYKKRYLLSSLNKKNRD